MIKNGMFYMQMVYIQTDIITIYAFRNDQIYDPEILGEYFWSYSKSFKFSIDTIRFTVESAF
jgi:hypothetical protein